MKILKKSKSLIYDILSTDASEGRKNFIYVIDDYIITGLIVLNIVAIILESYAPLYNSYKLFFHTFDIVSVIIFSIEYILRIWVADITYKSGTAKKNDSKLKRRLKYILSPLGIADLLAILPFYLPFFVTFDLRVLRILRLMRLFRIFKLAHYSSSLRMVGRVLKNRKDELIITIVAAFILLLLTSSIMYHIEHAVQPDKFPNIFASLWWAVATLTTIGYGDVYPVTGWGQFLAGLTALFGIGLVAIPTGLISSGFMEEIEKKKARKKSKEEPITYCPYCGKKIKE